MIIGEQFDEPEVLGAVLSVRGRETIIELWFNIKNPSTKSMIAEKLKVLLCIDKATVLYFKDNESSLKDKSTLKNAETYNYSKRKNTYY